MSLFEIINDDIKEAMLAKNRVKLDTLRGVKKEFIEAKTAKGAHGDLSDERAIGVLQKMAKQRKDSAEIYKSQNRHDLADTEIEQLKIIQEYLPKQLTLEELEAEINNIIKESDASSMKDMGKVMAVATGKLAGKAEGRAISEVVKRLLSS